MKKEIIGYSSIVFVVVLSLLPLVVTDVAIYPVIFSIIIVAMGRVNSVLYDKNGALKVPVKLPKDDTIKWIWWSCIGASLISTFVSVALLYFGSVKTSAFSELNAFYIMFQFVAIIGMLKAYSYRKLSGMKVATLDEGMMVAVYQIAVTTRKFFSVVNPQEYYIENSMGEYLNAVGINLLILAVFIAMLWVVTCRKLIFITNKLLYCTSIYLFLSLCVAMICLAYVSTMNLFVFMVVVTCIGILMNFVAMVMGASFELRYETGKKVVFRKMSTVMLGVISIITGLSGLVQSVIILNRVFGTNIDKVREDYLLMLEMGVVAPVIIVGILCMIMLNSVMRGNATYTGGTIAIVSLLAVVLNVLYNQVEIYKDVDQAVIVMMAGIMTGIPYAISIYTDAKYKEKIKYMCGYLESYKM